MAQSTPLNTETLPLNSHLTVTSALSANSWTPQQHRSLQALQRRYHEMIVMKPHSVAGQDMEPFQHRPAIRLMGKH